MSSPRKTRDHPFWGELNGKTSQVPSLRVDTGDRHGREVIMRMQSLLGKLSPHLGGFLKLILARVDKASGGRVSQAGVRGFRPLSTLHAMQAARASLIKRPRGKLPLRWAEAAPQPVTWSRLRPTTHALPIHNTFPNRLACAAHGPVRCSAKAESTRTWSAERLEKRAADQRSPSTNGRRLLCLASETARASCASLSLSWVPGPVRQQHSRGGTRGQSPLPKAVVGIQSAS